MTLKEHEKLKQTWLKYAKEAVRKRDWLRAGDCYKSAAFHEHIIKAVHSRED